MKRSISAALGIGFAMVASVAYAQPIAYFNAPYPNNVPPPYAYANYAAWASPGATTSWPTYWETAATGYGSNFYNIYFAPYGPTVDISNDNTLQLQVDVVSGTAGFLVQLYDGEGDGWEYQLGYGFGPGSYTLDVPLDDPSSLVGYTSNAGYPYPTMIEHTFSGIPTYLDLGQIISYHLELDPGSTNGSPNSYDVDWLGLGGVNVPEPTRLAFGAVACLLAVRRRRSAV